MARMLMIGDSQVRNMDRVAGGHWGVGGVTAISLSGACVNHVLDYVNDPPAPLTGFPVVALWVGGNDANPRGGRTFNLQSLRREFVDLVRAVQFKAPETQVVLMTANKRVGVDELGNSRIPLVNTIVQSVAVETGVIFANVQRFLERFRKLRPFSVYLKLDGVHVDDSQKHLVLECVRIALESDYARADPWSRRHTERVLLSRYGSKKTVIVKGAGCVLSNFYSANVTVFGRVFSSGEQAYQYTKAAYAGMADLQRDILHSRSPAQLKNLGKRATETAGPGWLEERKHVTREIWRARFQQQAIFRTALLETEGRPIVHDVHDLFWGWAEGEGANWYGKALMSFRDIQN